MASTVCVATCGQTSHGGVQTGFPSIRRRVRRHLFAGAPRECRSGRRRPARRGPAVTGTGSHVGARRPRGTARRGAARRTGGCAAAAATIRATSTAALAAATPRPARRRPRPAAGPGGSARPRKAAAAASCLEPRTPSRPPPSRPRAAPGRPTPPWCLGATLGFRRPPPSSGRPLMLCLSGSGVARRARGAGAAMGTEMGTEMGTLMDGRNKGAFRACLSRCRCPGAPSARKGRLDEAAQARAGQGPWQSPWQGPLPRCESAQPQPRRDDDMPQDNPHDSPSDAREVVCRCSSASTLAMRYGVSIRLGYGFGGLSSTPGAHQLITKLPPLWPSPC